MDGERSLFVFIRKLNRNLYFDETMLEILSMSEKSLKILLNIFGNANAASRLV